MNNLKNIVKPSFRLLLIVVLSTFATAVASAKTIYNSSSSTISTDILEFFDNIYDREDYKRYILANEYIGSGYNYTNNYYMCLTNEDIDTSNSLSVNSSCEKMYLYYRDSGSYVFEELSDNELIIDNSIYYVYENNYNVEKLLILANIGLFTFYLSNIILKLFRGD